jgi:hypothetical protein
MNTADQITLDCLLNKSMMSKHLKNKKINAHNKEDRKFYKKRIYNLFKEIITGNEPTDLVPDVKYAYDNFINSCIHYFKTIDNNDIRQEEYKDYHFTETSFNDISLSQDISANSMPYIEDNCLLMRSVKMDPANLDKYVKKISRKKKEEIILPKQKEVDLANPELKNKGIKKNITNKYEENTKKLQNEQETNYA